MRGFPSEEVIKALSEAYPEGDREVMDQIVAQKPTVEDLRLMREVAAAYPEGHRQSVNTWEVHMILRNHPNRFELVKEPMDESQARALAMQEFITPSGVTVFSSIIDGDRRRGQR